MTEKNMSEMRMRTLLKLKVPANKILNLERVKNTEEILQTVLRSINNKNKVILFGLGNTKGMGQNLIEYFNKYGEVI